VYLQNVSTEQSKIKQIIYINHTHLISMFYGDFPYSHNDFYTVQTVYYVP